MVEATLVTSSYALPQPAREAGRRLLERLYKMQAQIKAAYWTFDDENESWRLFLATPLTNSRGPLHIYHLLQSILKEMTMEEKGELELTDISVLAPRSMAVRELRQQFCVVEHEVNRRMRRSDGPYIYRLMPA